jgi:hypothetical protein
MSFYLIGPGSLNDAAFTPINAKEVRVVVENGLTGCVDETMSREKGRKIWTKLIKAGWRKTYAPRRTIRQIQDSING